MRVVEGYIVTYTYLIVVFVVSYYVSKKSHNNELSRNIIHICAGLGWNIFKLFFPASIHSIIISATFVLLTLFTEIKKVRFVEREDGDHGTIYYTLAMLVMSVLGYKNELFFDIFGISIMSLSCGDAAANILGSRYGKRKIYGEKSLEGSIGCFVTTFVVIWISSQIYHIDLSMSGIMFLAILCPLTELFSGNYDNIAISTVMYYFSYILLTDGITLTLGVSILVGAGMSIFAYMLKLLTKPAIYMLFYLITILVYFGSLRAFLALMLVFLILIMEEKIFGDKTEKITKDINKEIGTRNEIQLVSNCGVAIIAISLYGITSNEAFLIGFFAAIAEAIGDSVASDIGVLSESEPIDICTFRKIQKGMSGGISALGSCMGVMICVYTALVYMVLYAGAISNVFVIVVSGLAGIFLDSVLGSRVQVQYVCTECGKYTEKEIHCGKNTRYVRGMTFFCNSRINLLCNIASCCFASLIILARG